VTGGCGTNGIVCSKCAPGYALAIDLNCYYCPPVSTVALGSSSTQSNGL